jgi:hypothetical protein
MAPPLAIAETPRVRARNAQIIPLDSPELEKVAKKIRKEFNLATSFSEKFVNDVHVALTRGFKLLDVLDLLEGGEDRYVHVFAESLRRNLENGYSYPVVGVRMKRSPIVMEVYRHAEILGPSALIYDRYNPLPGSNSRAICVIHTRSPVLVFIDPTYGKNPPPERRGC